MKSLTLAAFLIAVGLLAGGAHAQVYSNGSLTGPLLTGYLPPSWFPAPNSDPDTMNASANRGVPGLQAFAAAPSASPDGGTWVGLMADGEFAEGFGQSVSGLLVGHSYLVTWYVANFGYTGSGGFTGANAIAVRFNNAPQGTGAIVAVGPSWVEQSIVFVSPYTANGLYFHLATTGRSYLSIDGIRVTEVPEPGSELLFAAAVTALVALQLRRRRVG